MHKRPQTSGTNKERNIPKKDNAQVPVSEKMFGQRRALQRALKRARQERQLRQIEVANLLNVPQSFVSKYEAGDRTLDFIEVLQLCKALGITLEKLLFLFEIEQASGTPDEA